MKTTWAKSILSLTVFAIIGQALTFSNWNQGEPNNAGKEDCVHVLPYVEGKWNDANCATQNINVFCEVLLPEGKLKEVIFSAHTAIWNPPRN